jgi:ATP-dependent Zn protease
MVLKANQRARDLLAGHRAQLQALALALLDKETLDAQEIDRLMASVSPPEDAASSQDTAPPLSVSLQSA